MFDPNKPPKTLAELAHRAFADFASQDCLGVKNKELKQYEYSNYAALGERVKNVACGLMQLGLERGQRLAIVAENRPEWATMDLACQMLGVVSVPLFSTLPPAQVKGILLDCGASCVVVSTSTQLKKIAAIHEELPDLKHIIVMDEIEATISFASLEKTGIEYSHQNPTAYEATWPAAEQNDIATIIYTSGTTGVPKGVMLSHRNIIANVEAIGEALREHYGAMKAETFLSFLPLAHIYERTAGFYLPLRLGASIAYCESLFTVAANLKEARPTLMMCVPRLYESLRDKIQDGAKGLPENKQVEYSKAIELAKKQGRIIGHSDGTPSLGFVEKIKYKVYDGMVYSKIRDGLGGRLRAFISGGAPMPPEIGALFLGLGITVLEGYGLTETSPVVAVNRPGNIKLGTVGQPVSSVEVRIESDGEICVRGDSVARGYWEKPEQTAESFQGSWFSTGDLGTFDDNYLKITGRKKDLLVLGNGKKVAPAPIEMRLMQSRFINQIVLLGDGDKGVSALVVPQLEAVREYAAKQNLGLETDEQLVASGDIKTLFRKEIDLLSDDLADFEKIRKIVLVREAFTVENGAMTPTLKIKRDVVAKKHAASVAE